MNFGFIPKQKYKYFFKIKKVPFLLILIILIQFKPEKVTLFLK